MVETGRTVSHYRITGTLGRGGMGEVFLAEDTSLHRQVAIKVLPDTFLDDPERLARFDREATLLASLNHPNIAAIYGLETIDASPALVMELVEGETLAQRIAKGALSIDETSDICRQIAEGLEAAHEKGIVHRDLKPANVKITPEGKVKILDFGLAKATQDRPASADSPTISEMTRPGVILGTAAYMSPEQARSKPVDKRADIWAFGCILYECLTGRRAFHGETIAETLARILEGTPDWGALPANSPLNIRQLLRWCLQRDPGRRLHDIADARIAIGDSAVYPTSAATAPRRLSPVWLATSGAVVLGAGILAGLILTRQLQPRPVARVLTATIKVEPGHRLEGSARHMERPSRTAIAISRDGTFIVYNAIEENPGPQAKPRLYLRRMDQSTAKVIPGTEGASNPFLSPDGRWVGFWADGQVKKVLVEGGVPTPLCSAAQIYGADWGGDNRIVFVDGDATGVSVVPADGGKLAALTRPDPTREEESHRLPSWLPSGKAVLFTVMKFYFDPKPSLALFRLDTGERRVLLEDAADGRYVSAGYIVFLRRGTLMAVRFDVARMTIIGEPVVLLENVSQALGLMSANYYTAAGQFGISDSGSLVYAAGGVVPPSNDALMWVDRKGIEQPVTPRQFAFYAPRLSPDGQRIAYLRWGPEFRVYVYDVGRDTNSALTHEGWTFYATWTPDGKRLIFSWGTSSIDNLYWQPYDGSAPMERRTTREFAERPGSWSSDGKTLAFVEDHPDTGYDIFMLDVSSGRVTPFLNSRFDEEYPEFSPKGGWIAYTSDESGRRQVYVQPYPNPGMRQQVSGEGGGEPLWARDGKQLFYRWENQVWVVDVRADGTFASSKPRLLFDKPGYSSGYPIRTYDLSLDSQRFLMVKKEQRKPAPITELALVENWFEELKHVVIAGSK